MKVHKRDHKYVQKEPDKGFDPERNKRIIDEVIADTEKMRVKKHREYDEALEERMSAVATYLTSLQQGGKTSGIEKYFGRKYLLYLRGQDIMQKIQENLTIVKNGKIIKRAGD